MNAYLEEDPIHVFESELSNLVAMWDDDPYSYNFFAMFAAPYIGRGLLDHAFGTETMTAQVTETEVWHVNADEPRHLDWNSLTYVAPGAYRASDHDPVVVGIDFHAVHLEDEEDAEDPDPEALAATNGVPRVHTPQPAAAPQAPAAVGSCGSIESDGRSGELFQIACDRQVDSGVGRQHSTS